MIKKLLSLFLTLCMVMSLVPTALAALEEIGFVSSGDVLTEENLAEEFAYTNDERTYTVALRDPTMTIRSLEKNYLNRDMVESVRIAEDGKTAVMTLKADLDFIRTDVGLDCVFDNGTRASLKATFINENKYFGYRYCTGIREPYAEDGAATLKSEASLAMGSSLWMTFAAGSWYTNEPVEVKYVAAADPSVATITYLGLSNKGNKVYELSSVGFGSTELTVETADGEIYTLPVEIMVPTAGFSRDTYLSEETYIHDRKFYYSENNTVFYYVVSQDIRRVITGVTIKEPHASAVAAEVSQDGKLITFTVDPTSGIHNERIDAETTFYNAGNSANLITSHYRISLYDGTGARWDNPFTDVAGGDWFHDAVKFVSNEGLMNGVSDVSFAPNATMTRAMLWTILARLDGVDTSGGKTWYQMGQDWSMANGVSDGERPMGDITREQIVTMLYRYADSPTVTGSLAGYPDASRVSSYAENAMIWATQAGIITGMADGTLTPGGNATRSQVAAMLMRFCANI